MGLLTVSTELHCIFLRGLSLPDFLLLSLYTEVCQCFNTNLRRVRFEVGFDHLFTFPDIKDAMTLTVAFGCYICTDN